MGSGYRLVYEPGVLSSVALLVFQEPFETEEQAKQAQAGKLLRYDVWPQSRLDTDKRRIITIPFGGTQE